MKVLFITNDFLPRTGGVANFIHHLADQLGKRGHTVSILAPRENGFDKIKPKNYHIYWCPKWKRLASVPFIFYTLFLVLTRRIEKVFIGHVMSTHAIGCLVLKFLFRIPSAILTHGNDLRYSCSTTVDTIVVRYLLNNASLILCNSRFTAETLGAKGYTRKSEIFHPGVDTTIFRPGVDISEIRKIYHLDGHKVILTVARLVEKKNIEGVLRALPKVIQAIPNVLYLIIGEGEKKEALEEISGQLGVKNHVLFLGRIENNLLPRYYCACDLYVMPSFEDKRSKDIETFGISYIEANACEKPVIGGRSGGVVDAIIEGETGLLVNPHDIDEIADAIIRLLRDSELARRIGENSRTRVEKELSWEKVGNQFIEFLQNIK